MYIIYDKDTGEELYKISTIDVEHFQSTTTEYIEKIVNGKIIQETKVRNIAYKEETTNE